MPSTATTNVTIGTLPDLIGSVVATSAADDDQPAFDSLLQSPPAPPIAPTSPPSDDQTELAYRPGSAADQRDVSPPPLSDDSKNHESTSDTPSQTPQDSPPKTATATEQSPGPNRAPAKADPHENDPSPSATEPVIAESLAGIAAVALVAAPAATPVIAAEGRQARETEAVEPTSAGGKQAAAGPAGVNTTSTAKLSANGSDATLAENDLVPPLASGVPGVTQVAPEAQPQVATSALGKPTPAPQPPTGPLASTALQSATTLQPVAQPNMAEATVDESAPNPGTSGAIHAASAGRSALKSGTAEPANNDHVAVSSANQSSDAKSSDAKLSDVKAPDAKSPTERSPKETSTDDQAESSDDVASAVANATQEIPASSHKQQQALSNDNRPSPALDSSSIVTPTADIAVAATSNLPPPAVPIAVTPPALDPGPAPKSGSGDNQVTNIASPPRPRLPADLLAQSPGGPSRRPTVEIDATRLLTRVARAFTAAQDRDGEIRLRLSPPELGSLRLEVRVQDGAMVARLQTETDAARTAIIDNLPALRDRLSEQGVRIERFDVDLMQRQPGGMPDQPGGRQQPDLPSAQVTAIAPPRRVIQAPVSSGPTLPTLGSADGLNVVV